MPMDLAASLYDEKSEALTFAATGTNTVTNSTDTGLTGTIWASGTITPHVNGRPQTIEVPADTIGPTFEALRERVAAGEATVGFDHPDSGSVAAETGVGELGRMRSVARSADGEQIVLTDSELTNSKAVEAFEAGAFDDYDYSVIGKLVPETNDEGQPVRADDGALRLAAARIHRVDLVKNGAVAGAAVGAMPALAARAGALARGSPSSPSAEFATTLRLAAARIGDAGEGDDDDNGNGHGYDPSMSNNNGGSPFDGDPDTIEAAQNALDEASALVEAKDEAIENLEAENEALEAHASGFEEIAASHGFDPDDEDFEAQAVIDSYTEDLRAEVARLEASLPAHDTDEDGIEDRAEELEGESVAGLEAMAGDLSRETLRSKERAAELGGAIAASETSSVGSGSGKGNGLLGGSSSGGSGGLSDDEADRLAVGCLNAEDSLAVQASDASPSEYVRERYNVDPTEYSDEQALHDAMLEAESSGGDA